MELSELTAYAAREFHISEERRWTGIPGFSVLADPDSGRWLALLMSQWDPASGTEIQRCDIRCGQEALRRAGRPYLSRPFRMKGSGWIGVTFDERTEPDVVFHLFSCAVHSIRASGCTIVLETPPAASQVIYPDAPRPDVGGDFHADIPAIPERIRGMMPLYEHKDSSFTQKCRNFYIQGKFMEDYEDDSPWAGTIHRYFPAYHDLSIPQLRGYFTWRTHARKGDYQAAPATFAYIYLYELLNGIGASSPEDSLTKMKEFGTGFIDAGKGDAAMLRNLQRWMLEYAVIKGLPPETAREYAPAAIIRNDDALAVLREPGNRTDDEIFAAIRCFAGKDPARSPAVTKDEARGKRLFASAWRMASQQSTDTFTRCFGSRKAFPWHPLGNAIYWESGKHPDTDYALDCCRTYSCRHGRWQETRYDELGFHPAAFDAFIHEADRVLRRALKTGHYLKSIPGYEQAAACAEAALEAERQAEIEAARPQITIDISHLARIRQDASATRDSLLTEEEMDDAQEATEDGPQGNDAIGIPYQDILMALLDGRPVRQQLRERRLMPSLVADAINEALSEEIGDNVIECDGDDIIVIEDYRDDILRIIGGKGDE